MPDRLALEGGTPVRAEPLAMGKGAALLGEEERAAVLEVLESRSLFRYYGPQLLGTVEAFEREACAVLGVEHAVATSSGTAALRTALAALAIGCGDEVIVPSFTFIATVNAVVVAGAVPVFAEIDDTLGLDAIDVEAKITPRTAAIVPVHLENVACDLDPIMKVAERHRIAVIEDAAQSFGASYRGRALGTIGTMGAYSMQLEKNITSGEGGLLVTEDPSLALRAARYQDQGGQFVTGHAGARGSDAIDPFVGENLRLTEIAGAIARAQLRKLPEILAAMRTNKARILDGIGAIDGLQRRRIIDREGDGSSSITWFLPDAARAARFAEAMRAEGIPSGQVYDGKPVYATPSILQRRTATNKGGPWHCVEHPTDVTYEMGMCPRTESLVARSATVAVGAAWDERDCADVAAAVRKVAGALR